MTDFKTVKKQVRRIFRKMDKDENPTAKTLARELSDDGNPSKELKDLVSRAAKELAEEGEVSQKGKESSSFMAKRIATRVIQSRENSIYIRQAGEVLASNLTTYLDKKGPSIYIKFRKNGPKLLGRISPTGVARAVKRLQDGGIDVSKSDLSTIGFTLVDRGDSFWSPSSRVIAIRKLDSGISDSMNWDYFLKKKFPETFLHEFVHAIDFIRGTPKPYGDEIRNDQEKYLLHDLEVNARIQEMMSNYDKELGKKVMKTLMNSDDLEWDLLSHLSRTTSREVNNMILEKLDPRLSDLILKDRDLKKKFSKRIYTELERSKQEWRRIVKKDHDIKFT